MNKYKWDIKSIIERKQKYVDLYNDENDYYLSEYLIPIYDELIKTYNMDKRNILDFLELEDFSNDEKKSDLFWTEVLPFVNMEAAEILMDNPLSLSTPSDFTPDVHDLLVLTNDELLEIANEMFKNIPNKKLYKKFLEMTDPNKRLLNIQYSKYFYGYLGKTIIDTYSHTSYGNIIRTNTCQDIIALFHEPFHMIVRQHEHPFANDCHSVIYNETEGYFANLIIADLARKIGLSNKAFLQFQMYETIQNIDLHKQTVKTLSNFFDRNNKDQSSFLDLNLENNLNSVFSFLTAVDFYYLYQKDPEKTIDKIMNLDLLMGEDIKEELSDYGISFFEDNNANLQKHFKKIKKLNGIK